MPNADVIQEEEAEKAKSLELHTAIEKGGIL
jgi:hypothetical protein